MDYQEVKKNPDTSEADRPKSEFDEALFDHQSVRRNPQAIGSTAIASPDASRETLKPGILSEQPNSTPELGQIVPLMPPGYEAEPAVGDRNETSFNTSVGQKPNTGSFSRRHAMSGERLSTKTVDALQGRERQLAADGDIASFVDFIDQAKAEFHGKEAA